ncbi:predicted protein [Pyrenophora tritici-repentis Pt-1C-BFP]|uniref:Uncharacterized protein n=1 Tax=Pyrenophora tritici-repentis (strain Pt-1C-BFP) TaxID=426418 RepID=B2WH80_PYRTR|nr:uncharacterized protein PTRG_09339 [Pyrenophora tritici-repentis Pt-1C-BFP]EDU42390.1 predicted protein [Pyrenophora tritici-repentis Pt-1C-BFP]
MYEHKHQQLYDMSWPIRFLAQALRNDMKILDLIQKTKFTPYIEGIGRYNIINLESSIASAAYAANLELHYYLGRVHYDRNIRTSNLTPYMPLLREVGLNLIDLEAEVFNIRLRRDKSNKRQTIFNAFYHRWNLIVHAHKFTEAMSRIIKHHQKTYSGIWSNRTRQGIQDSLKNITAACEALYFLYRFYLPVYMRRLDLMSASELDQNILGAKRYWLTYYQTRRQNEQRMAELDENLAMMSKARMARAVARKNRYAAERKLSVVSGGDLFPEGVNLRGVRGGEICR